MAINKRRTAREAILVVLENARTKSEFTHDSIATQILDVMHLCGIDTRNIDERMRDNAAAPVPKPEFLERLSLRIEHRDARDNIVEVLGREHEIRPARAAYNVYRETYPDRLLMIIEGGGRVIVRSDREDKTR
jgi:hypothetical protein